MFSCKYWILNIEYSRTVHCTSAIPVITFPSELLEAFHLDRVSTSFSALYLQQTYSALSRMITHVPMTKSLNTNPTKAIVRAFLPTRKQQWHHPLHRMTMIWFLKRGEERNAASTTNEQKSFGAPPAETTWRLVTVWLFRDPVHFDRLDVPDSCLVISV